MNSVKLASEKAIAKLNTNCVNELVPSYKLFAMDGGARTVGSDLTKTIVKFPGTAKDMILLLNLVKSLHQRQKNANRGTNHYVKLPTHGTRIFFYNSEIFFNTPASSGVVPQQFTY